MIDPFDIHEALETQAKTKILKSKINKTPSENALLAMQEKAYRLHVNVPLQKPKY